MILIALHCKITERESVICLGMDPENEPLSCLPLLAMPQQKKESFEQTVIEQPHCVELQDLH